MQLKPVIFGIFVVAVFLGSIFIAQGTGFWATTGKGSSGGEGSLAPGASVAEIKGWMTLGEVAEAYQIPPLEILNAFQLPADTPLTTPIKELESSTFSPTELRTWIQARLDSAAAP